MAEAVDCALIIIVAYCHNTFYMALVCVNIIQLSTFNSPVKNLPHIHRMERFIIVFKLGSSLTTLNHFNTNHTRLNLV
jgi:hypothetical protein